jgi:hypothetical protein
MWGGDQNLWGSLKLLEIPQSVRFRWATDAKATSGLWQLSDKPFSTGAPLQAPVLAKGALTFVPVKGQQSIFPIDLTTFLPKVATAATATYYVRVIPLNGTQQAGPPSAAVTVNYGKSSSTTNFPDNMGLAAVNYSTMVWDGKHNQPIPGATLMIQAAFPGGPILGTWSTVSDAAGCAQLSFNTIPGIELWLTVVARGYSSPALQLPIGVADDLMLPFNGGCVDLWPVPVPDVPVPDGPDQDPSPENPSLPGGSSGGS